VGTGKGIQKPEPGSAAGLLQVPEFRHPRRFGTRAPLLTVPYLADSHCVVTWTGLQAPVSLAGDS
jgi:hypothetical protein